MTDQGRILYAGGEIDGISPESVDESLDRLEVVHESDFVTALESARETDVRGVIASHRTNGFRGVDLLESMRQEGLGIPVAVVVREEEAGEVARRAVEADATALVPAGDDDALEALADAIERNMSTEDGRRREEDRRMPISDLPFEDERRLKERVLDEAPIGITVSNADDPDNPIIYLNKSFESLTGYSAEEVVGANHRFLQGSETDTEKVEELGRGVSEGRDTRVTLRNYTRDGDLFWNQVDVSPISDSENETSYYVGFQMDVTERERFRHELEEEREAFDRLIDRMNSLINDITRCLVRAESREEVEESVVEKLGEEYDQAWIGRYSPTDGEVTVDETSIRDREERQNRISVGEEDSERVVSDVVERHETSVVEGDEAESLRRRILDGSVDDSKSGSSFCVTVPVTYQSTTYGVIGVWGDGERLDTREPGLLASVARSVGASINDVLTKRTMSTDSVVRLGIRIENDGSPLVEVADEVGGSLEYEGAVTQGGGIAILVSTSADPGEAVEAAGQNSGVVDAEVLVSDEEGTVVQIRVDRIGLVSEVSEHGGRLRSMEVTPNGVEAELDVGNEREARRLLDRLKQTYSGSEADVSLATYRTVEEASQTTQGFRNEVRDRLTQRQMTALQKAYTGGFFDWPRRVEGERLAESMDIVPSTYHQHLRTAERKLIEAFLNG
ncbi:bacterio-opsin activator domain-containing protein [Halorutilales archaeon Cl-col2-1]